MLGKILLEENPFFHRGPVHNSRYFYGRVREIQRILRFVREGQAVSIVGPRRIGKSSLLWQLCNPEVPAKFNLDTSYKFVYVDCQELVGSLSRSDIYAELLSSVSEAVGEDTAHQLPSGQPITYLAFEKKIARLMQSTFKIVFIFDEFEVLAGNPHLDETFFTQLRALGQKGNVIYITASGATLHELTFYDQNVLTSPFFNIFFTQWLGLMSNDDLLALLNGLLQDCSICFNRDDINFVQTLAGAYPFFVQLAAYLVFEEKLESSHISYQKIKRQFMRESKGHFEHIWRNLSGDEQVALHRLCCDNDTSIAASLIESLEQKCLLVDGRIFSTGFAQFMLVQTRGQRIIDTKTAVSNGARPHPTTYLNNGVQSTSDSRIHITGAINPAHRIFVREMLKDKDVEEANFQLLYDGYANYGIYLVKLRTSNQTGFLLSNVLKFASAKDVMATEQNYKKYVKNRLSIAFPDEPEFWFPPDLEQIPQSEWSKELAASMYRYALTDGESVHNLQEIYQRRLMEQQSDAAADDPVEIVLHRLFRALERWQDSIEHGVRLPTMLHEYKRLFNKLDKMEDGAVKLEALQLPEHVRHQPKQLRYEEKVIWRGRPFTNPIYWVEQLFQQLQKQQWLEKTSRRRFPGMVHGDLNFRNVLVEKSGNDFTSIWLIDFSDTHAGHPLRDYGTLEADLKFVVTPINEEDFAAENGYDPPILHLEKLLLSPRERHEIDLEAMKYSSQNRRLHSIWTYTRSIRAKARRDILQGADVRPYYLSLLHATLPVLYYEQLSQWQLLYAFLSAALICEAIDALETVEL